MSLIRISPVAKPWQIKLLLVIYSSLIDIAFIMNHPRILVAEDTDFGQLIIQQILSIMGIDCTIVDNGQAVFDILKTEADYDLVLLDIEMPYINGLLAIKKIFSDYPDLSKKPIIATTGHKSKESHQTLINAGFATVIYKPFTVEGFKTELSKYLKVGMDTKEIKLT